MLWCSIPYLDKHVQTHNLQERLLRRTGPILAESPLTMPLATTSVSIRIKAELIESEFMTKTSDSSLLLQFMDEKELAWVTYIKK